MFKKVFPYLALMGLGLTTFSCEDQDLEEPQINSTAELKAESSDNILIEETFESAEPMATFHGQEFGTKHAFSTVTNPVFDGRKVARLELRDTDPLESNGTRAEMTVIKDKVEKEMWYSFAVYLPAADFAYDSEKEIISQWHQSGGASPPSFLQIEEDRFAFAVANKVHSHVYYDLGSVTKNVWHQFTFHYINSNRSEGLVEIWKNGRKVVTHRGGNMYALENFPKWKVGIYKWKWNGNETTDTRKRVLYYDNIRVGAADASMAEMSATASGQQSGGAAASAQTTTTSTSSSEALRLTFVNAQTDRNYKVLTNGGSLNLAEMGSNKVSIRADLNQTAGSVRFVVRGPKNYDLIDSARPYALFGDDGSGNYYYGNYLPAGSYTLTVTPYSGRKGTGTPGTPLTVRFTITNDATASTTASGSSSTASVSGSTSTASSFSASALQLSFINAQIDRVYKELTNGGSLSFSQMGSKKVSVRADLNQTAGSVRFVVQGPKDYDLIDNTLPYALFGDDGSGNYYYGDYLPAGSYTMTVTPYSGRKGTGTPGTPLTVQFSINS